jgi:tRNA A-37 threonylcarbamoyl transferase component Bud32
MTDAETTIDWATQIAMICQRFEAALRAGETLDGLELWVQQVPEPMRPLLREELRRCRGEVSPESIETRVLSSDAVLGCIGDRNDFFPAEQPSGSAVEDCSTFHGLSKAAIVALQQRLEQRSFPRGTQLLRQGQQARGLYLILHGSVDVVDTNTGERIDCDGAGSVLGEMSLLASQPCSADVVATSDVGALVLSTEGYQELKSTHPELEIALSQLVSDRLGGRKHDALCGKTMGDYQLVRCINRGGMGVVYEGRKIGTNEAVALKMLRHRFIYDDHIQGRFDQEARLLEDLLHPNIVSLRHHFLAYRTRFLVLDLCDGADLFRLLRVRGPLDEEIVRAILGQVAEGVLYLHDSGVIHRDLKPGNVLVDRSGRVRLTDFGLSKLLESEVPEGKAVGTPSYMPPEQFRTADVGPPCDWYAIGCLTFEMLTARMLFAAATWTEMFDVKRRSRPSDRWPVVDASPELCKIIRGALEPKAKDRRLDLEAISRWAANVDRLFGE